MQIAVGETAAKKDQNKIAGSGKGRKMRKLSGDGGKSSKKHSPPKSSKVSKIRGEWVAKGAFVKSRIAARSSG